MTKCEHQIMMEEMGMNEEVMFEMLFAELDYLVNELSKENLSEDSFDIDSFLLKRVQKSLEILQSIHLIYNAHSDTSSLSVLTRVIYEYYATLHLIFVHTTSKKEQMIRFLLYLKDGVSERQKNLEQRNMKFDPRYITKEKFVQTEKQCNEAIENDKSAIAYINQLLYDKEYSDINQEIIEHSNWKYKNMSRGKNKNTYSWNDLCALFDEKNATTISGYLSQFVHGLGISYIQDTNDTTPKYSISSGIVIMGHIKKLLSQRFAKSICIHNIDFRKTDMASHLLSMAPQAYLDRIVKELSE